LSGSFFWLANSVTSAINRLKFIGTRSPAGVVGGHWLGNGELLLVGQSFYWGNPCGAVSR
jgi:hypothetical protein